MGIHPTFIKREAQPYAGIREQVGRDDLATIVPRTLSELLAFLKKHQIDRIGPPFIRYLVVDYNTGGVDVDVSVPVDAPVLPADNRVHRAEIPAGTFVTVLHRGSYETLVTTTAEFLAWAKQKRVEWQVVEKGKVTQWTARVEHYLVAPPEETDPTKWLTEIAILRAADSA